MRFLFIILLFYTKQRFYKHVIQMNLLNNDPSSENKKENIRPKAAALAIPFPTFIEKDGERKFVRCSLCKHYNIKNQKCKLFNKDALASRLNQENCGYAAKYFEKDGVGNKLMKLVWNLFISICNKFGFIENLYK